MEECRLEQIPIIAALECAPRIDEFISAIMQIEIALNEIPKELQDVIITEVSDSLIRVMNHAHKADERKRMSTVFRALNEIASRYYLNVM